MTDKVPKYDYPSSQSGGIKVFGIRGIFDNENNRLSEEFTDEERKLRRQWLKDQELSPNEPRPVSKEWERLTRNPIRRFLSKPWQLMEDKLTPVFGEFFSIHFRYVVPRVILGTMAVYWAWYHLKYNQNDWTSAYGTKVYFPRAMVLPGDKGYPLKMNFPLEPSDYDDRGFKARKVFLD